MQKRPPLLLIPPLLIGGTILAAEMAQIFNLQNLPGAVGQKVAQLLTDYAHLKAYAIENWIWLSITLAASALVLGLLARQAIILWRNVRTVDESNTGRTRRSSTLDWIKKLKGRLK